MTESVPFRFARIRVFSASVILTLPVMACAPDAPSAAGRSVLDFDSGWTFHLGDAPGAELPAFDDSGWRRLDLPHDWSIEGPFDEENPAGPGGGALPGGTGWYRKTFTLSDTGHGRLVFVDFDGIYRNSEVWINGQFLGKRPYGYSSFRYELTPHLVRDGVNVLAVRVDNSQQPNSRWYSGSGIYRHVRLVTTDSVHVAHWGTHVTTPDVTPDRAVVRVTTTIRNATQERRPVTLQTTILDASGEEVAAVSSAAVVPGDSGFDVVQDLDVPGPELWSPLDPDLYRVFTRIECGTRLCDNVVTTLGFRTFSFDLERGFILNGERVQIRGVNLHHDLGALGAALNDRALERQLEIMKEMGVNAIRVSHNPPAPELLDLADRMGFIVMDEAFDVWRIAKTRFDYHLDWDEWHERDLADMVRRDRNHPSIVVWSIGNEIREQGDSSGIPITRELAEIVRSLDPTRPVAAGLDQLGPSNFVIQSGALDLIGYNYRHHLWADHREAFPEYGFIATEAASSLHTRGHYDQPSDSIARYGGPWMEDPGPTPDADFRLSAYDHRAAAWGSLHEESLLEIRKDVFLSGMFLWTGIDYLGEPTPYGWPARSSYFGAVDLAGFPKDAFYLYQSEWTDDPVLHLLPHWNWTPGETIDVWAYTNLDEVELSLNGNSLGVRERTEEALHLAWRVPFAPGTLRAVGSRNGQVVETREVKTAGPASSIELLPDRDVIRADGRDLSFVTVNVLDDDGVIVPDADNLVRFRLDGDAVIAGVDNGNQISHAPFLADSVRVFNGKGLLVVRAGRSPSTVTVRADSDGLDGGSTRITAQRATASAPR